MVITVKFLANQDLKNLRKLQHNFIQNQGYEGQLFYMRTLNLIRFSSFELIDVPGQLSSQISPCISDISFSNHLF